MRRWNRAAGKLRLLGPVSLAGNTTIHTDSNASLTLAGNVTLNGRC